MRPATAELTAAGGVLHGSRLSALRTSLGMDLNFAARALHCTGRELVDLENGRLCFTWPEGEEVAAERLRNWKKAPKGRRPGP